jgi:hypothetical protein
MAGFWPIAVLVTAVSMAGCAATNYDVGVEDSSTVAHPSQGVEEFVEELTIPTAPVPPMDEWLRLLGVTVEALGPTHRIVFDLSRVPDSVTHFRLSSPPRVVLDVHGPHRAAGSVERYLAEDALVERVRVGHYDGRMRLVVDLSEQAPAYTVREEGNALVTYLGDLSALAEENAEADSSPEEAPDNGPGANESADSEEPSE